MERPTIKAINTQNDNEVLKEFPVGEYDNQSDAYHADEAIKQAIAFAFNPDGEGK